MSTKKKTIKGRMEQHRDAIILLVPLTAATIIVWWNLIPAEILGLFADAYTVALLATLTLITLIALKRR